MSVNLHALLLEPTPILANSSRGEYTFQPLSGVVRGVEVPERPGEATSSEFVISVRADLSNR
jgi:hypothetical protein